MMKFHYILRLLSELTITEVYSAGNSHPKWGIFPQKARTSIHIVSIGINNYEINQTGIAFGNAVNDAHHFSVSVRKAY